MHFDLTDLRLFVQLAEAGSMSAASRRAHLSVATISARIKALEGQFMARLVWRSNRGIELTPAGERLLKYARGILSQVDALKASFQEANDDSVGHVRMYANITAVTEILPDILGKFLSERPLTSIELQERPNPDILRAVLDGSADIGVLTGRIDAEGVQVIPFSKDGLVVVAPRGHPLTEVDTVTLKLVADYPFIEMYEGSTLANYLHDRLREIGAEVYSRIQLYTFESVCRMVEAGVGVGIVPDFAAQRYRRTMDFEILPLNEPWVERERSILVRNLELLPACAQSLIEAIRAGAAEAKDG